MKIPPGDKLWLDNAVEAILDHVDPHSEVRTPHISVTREMEAINDDTVRVFAQTELETGDMHLAPQFFDLDDEHRLGILAHELGHMLLREYPAHTEREADMVMADAGLKIMYDKENWPGKGLQYLELEN